MVCIQFDWWPQSRKRAGLAAPRRPGVCPTKIAAGGGTLQAAGDDEGDVVGGGAAAREGGNPGFDCVEDV